MSDPREALARLRSLAETGELDRFCRRHGLRLVVAFGSVVDGEGGSRPGDLDLAVLPDRRTRDSDWIDLVTEIIGFVRSDAVDVLDLSRAGVLARANALGWGRPLYEDEQGLFARRQMAAMGQRMELGWLADLDLELMAEH